MTENKGTILEEIPKEEVDEREILQKFEREYAYRNLRGTMRIVVFVLAVAFSLFHLYTAARGTFPPTLQRAPHVGFALLLTFLLYPANPKDIRDTIPWYDYILAGFSVVVALYHVFNFMELALRAGAFTQTDFIISVIAVLLVLEATRRLTGPVVALLAVAFLLYGHFGDFFPGLLGHRGFSIMRIATFSWISTEAILGIPIRVSSTFIFLFVLFATFLKKTKIGDWLTELAIGLTGFATGGPAKAAVIASATQGTISGSSVANTVGTGAVTIPLMRKVGYKPEFAGAVEAAASTGGQLMPPIMGAAAFIMSEFTNIPYWNIVLCAIIPAILYFAGVFANVHFEAKRLGLVGVPREQLPDWKQLLKTKWFLAAPIVVIVYLLGTGYTPMLAAFWAIVASVLISMILPETRMTPKEIVMTLEEGARAALSVVVVCAAAGIIIGVITLTGLGLKLAGFIIHLAGGNLLFILLLTMVASILLGMGIPTTAKYIIMATIAAPALTEVGVPLIAAHLFVFYFAIVADITPPVALAAYAGAGIANANPMKTGVQAFRLGLAAYLVPYFFVYSPVLVLVDVTPVVLIRALITSVLGICAIGGSTTGFFVTRSHIVESVLLFLGGVLLVQPKGYTDLVGLALVTAIWIWQRRRVAVDKAREISA